MAEIRMTNGSIVLVDDEWLDCLSQFTWVANGQGYAAMKVNRKVTMMHRIISGAQPGQIVDHKNGLILDNRAENLRFCTHTENMQNRKMHTSNACGVKGVYRDHRPRKNPYRVQIRAEGKKIVIGSFPTLDEAHAAYDAASKKYHGEFSRLANV